MLNKELEEIIEKSIIKLPKDIDLSEAEKLLVYIAKKLPASINYDFSAHVQLKYFSPEEFDKNAIISELNVRINQLKKPFASDSFIIRRSKDTHKFSAIQFEIVAGLGPKDYRPEVLLLWEDVRNLIKDYFENLDQTKNTFD